MLTAKVFELITVKEDEYSKQVFRGKRTVELSD